VLKKRVAFVAFSVLSVNGRRRKKLTYCFLSLC